MSVFKIGDEVVCIDNTAQQNLLDLGGVYTVLEVFIPPHPIAVYSIAVTSHFANIRVMAFSDRFVPKLKPCQTEASRVNSCNHEFVMYNGFKESYQFCKKCDSKQEIL